MDSGLRAVNWVGPDSWGLGFRVQGLGFRVGRPLKYLLFSLLALLRDPIY